MAEVPEMHSNTNVRVNWFNVNVPTILAVLGVGWGIATYVADMQTRISGVEDSVSEAQTSLDNLVSIPYRMNAVEGQIVQTNARLDRLIENLTNSVDLLRKDVNTVGTKVEVLSSKIDALGPEKKAGFQARLIPFMIQTAALALTQVGPWLDLVASANAGDIRRLENPVLLHDFKDAHNLVRRSALRDKGD